MKLQKLQRGLIQSDEVRSLLAFELDLAVELKKSHVGWTPYDTCFGEAELSGWTLKREYDCWYAKGPGMPLEETVVLKWMHQDDVKIVGGNTSQDPLEAYLGFPVPEFRLYSREAVVGFLVCIHSVVKNGKVAYDRIIEIISRSNSAESDASAIQDKVDA